MFEMSSRMATTTRPFTINTLDLPLKVSYNPGPETPRQIRVFEKKNSIVINISTAPDVDGSLCIFPSLPSYLDNDVRRWRRRLIE